MTISTITNTTISANIANNRGGGIRVNAGTMNLKNVTIHRNNGGTAQGGIATVSGTTNLTNTIVAGNVSVSQPDCAGPFVSGGNNLIGISNCTGFGSATNDQVGSSATPINPLLGALANNGGTTQTHALLASSTAIDRGKATDCPTSDQRGTTRPRDGDNNGSLVCDIGAFELVNAAQADTRVTLTSPSQVVIGTNFDYLITLNNLGPATATNVSVTLTMPAGVSFVSASNPICKLNASNAQVVDCIGLAHLTSGSTQPVQVIAKAPSTAGTLTATAKSSSATTDPVSTNNTVNRNTTFVAPPNLAMALSASPSTVVTGNNFNYTLTISNVGSGAASSAVVSFPLPSQVSFVSATSGCTASGATVTCNLGAINPGASLSRTVTVIANTAGTVSATATITSSVPADSSSSNNSASVNVTIVSPADLAMDVSASKTAVFTDEQFTYTVTISNNGPGAATAATLP